MYQIHFAQVCGAGVGAGAQYHKAHPDGHNQANQGQDILDDAQTFQDEALDTVDVVVQQNKLESNQVDEGQDVGGKADGAACHKVIRRPIVAVINVNEANSQHEATKEDLEQNTRTK